MQHLKRMTALALTAALVGGVARGRAHGAQDGSRQATSTSRSSELAAIGASLFVLESRAAAIAFGDPTGQGAGADDLRYESFQSSITFLQRAVELDSSSARGWYWLGKALSSRAYRGVGARDSADVARSVTSFKRAKAMLGSKDPLLSQVDRALAEEIAVQDSLHH